MTMQAEHIAENPEVMDIVKRALREDLGERGDVTSNSVVPADATARAEILSREPCVVAGLPVADLVFHLVDARLVSSLGKQDGARVGSGESVMTIEGPARALLTAERTALNFMQRMSGTATLTRAFVDEVQATSVTILDTRKTTPGLRVLEKYAVRCGGGANHRMGLFDRVMLKDNHRRFWDCDALDQAVDMARATAPGVDIEVEVETEAELESALKSNPEWVLLDNMDVPMLRKCVAICAGRSRLEASGGISLANVRAIAETGVDAISLGCLTHSAPAVDFSLELLS